MCLNPIQQLFEGRYKKTNYNGLKGEKYSVDVYTKCGHCEQCVAEKANNWVIRNTYEAKRWQKMSFITLTYARNTHFLVKKDLQDFIKRLRRRLEYHNKLKIRFFACGEYGTLYNRPHFHVIIYNWLDEKPKYMGLSKKHFPIFQSELIQNVWGHGRTTYQIFNEHEIPYISLYDTARSNECREYKIKCENVKELIKKYKKEMNNKMPYLTITSIKNQIKELSQALKESKKAKDKYIKIKEFNTWSTSIGWEKFFEMYQKYKFYDFHEYIEDKEFLTPTSWVKKLANWGFEDARKEMLRRSSELVSNVRNSEELKAKNMLRVYDRTKQNIFDYAETKEQIEL